MLIITESDNVWFLVNVRELWTFSCHSFLLVFSTYCSFSVKEEKLVTETGNEKLNSVIHTLKCVSAPWTAPRIQWSKLQLWLVQLFPSSHHRNIRQQRENYIMPLSCGSHVSPTCQLLWKKKGIRVFHWTTMFSISTGFWNLLEAKGQVVFSAHRRACTPSAEVKRWKELILKLWGFNITVTIWEIAI